MDARGGTLASLILVTVACGLASIGVWHGVSVRAEHDAHAALHQAIRLVALNADLRTQLNSAAAARDLRNCRNGAGPVCYRVAGHIAEARRLIAEITHDLEEMGGAARYDAVRQNLAAHQARLADARWRCAPHRRRRGRCVA